MPQAGEPLPPVDLRDEAVDRPVLASECVHHGAIWDVRRDTVDLGGQGSVVREYIDHPGAVWIAVLDGHERLLLQAQYRHPVRRRLWEVPAGLLDVPGESPLDAARRELAEEADLRAARWDLLLEEYTSPGGSNERIWLFLARELTSIPAGERFERQDEEVGMDAVWLTLDDAERAVFAGRLTSPSAIIATLAVQAARRSGWRELRTVEE